MKLKILIPTVLLSLILALCVFFYFSSHRATAINEEASVVEKSAALAKETGQMGEQIEPEGQKMEEVSFTTISISVAGDCTLGFDERRGYGNSFPHEFERQQQDYGFFLQKVKHIFAESDLSLVNLEGALTDSKVHADKSFVFRGPPDFARILAAGNIDAVNLANNHTFDYLEQGYRDTLRALRGAGIGYFGNEKVYATTIKGINIKLLGFTQWEAMGSTQKILTQIEEAKFDADLVIVSFHWGDEYAYHPNDFQKTMGRLAIDSGADLVWGHHPHVLQGIEGYEGRNIVYSLGNFSFGGNRNPSDRDTIIFQQVFEFSNGMLSGVDYKIIPCSISSVSERNNFQPIPLSGAEGERVIRKVLGP